MDFKLCTACAATLLALSPVFAQQAPERSHGPSRAEVRADFRLWREAGLMDFEMGNMGPEAVFSRRYEQALQAYRAARSSSR